MGNLENKRELILFGACLASKEIRDRLTSADFVDNDLASCFEEMQNVTSGKIKGEDMRFLPSFMESLRCPNMGNALDGIEAAVKSYSRMKRIQRVCQLGGFAKTDQDIEQFKRQVEMI